MMYAHFTIYMDVKAHSKIESEQLKRLNDEVIRDDGRCNRYKSVGGHHMR